MNVPIEVPDSASRGSNGLRTRSAVAGIVLALLILLAGGRGPRAAASGCTGVKVRPATRLQAVIDRHPPGTTFCMSSGTFRIARAIVPKAGDRFVAVRPRRAVLTGGDTTSMAFDPNGVASVVVRGLVITRFAPPDQGGMAALKAAGHWKIINNEISHNDNTGLYHEGDALGENHFRWANNLRSISEWKGYGQDVNGTFNVTA